MYQQSGLQLLLLMPHGESLVDIQFLDSFTILMMMALMIVPSIYTSMDENENPSTQTVCLLSGPLT
jgi:hypothetical protein